MNDKLIAIKATIAAFFTALGAFLGWQGVMALVWIAAMALDYLSGTAAAMKAGEWCSARAREGLWHKAGMIIAVICACIADFVMTIVCANIPREIVTLDWPVVLLPVVLAWYIITELGSILENAVKLGATVPDWLVKLLKVGLKAVDKAAGGETPVENKSE